MILHSNQFTRLKCKKNVICFNVRGLRRSEDKCFPLNLTVTLSIQFNECFTIKYVRTTELYAKIFIRTITMINLFVGILANRLLITSFLKNWTSSPSLVCPLEILSKNWPNNR